MVKSQPWRLGGKKIAVFGASGNLGRPITYGLLDKGAVVCAFARRLSGLVQLRADNVAAEPDNLLLFDESVLNLHALARRQHSLPSLSGLDGYVYCVGQCPPQGFDREVSRPLTQLLPKALEWEIDRHAVGLVQAHSYLVAHELLRRGGRVVVIGSAITRLEESTCPPWLNSWHYLAANAAKEALVRGLRHNPATRHWELRIHYLAFGAVNTPFHHGCEHKPPAMLEVDEVVEEVLAALCSEEILHKQVLAQPTTA